jgi:hypothetical protein
MANLMESYMVNDADRRLLLAGHGSARWGRSATVVNVCSFKAAAAAARPLAQQPTDGCDSAVHALVSRRDWRGASVRNGRRDVEQYLPGVSGGEPAARVAV